MNLSGTSRRDFIKATTCAASTMLCGAPVGMSTKSLAETPRFAETVSGNGVFSRNYLGRSTRLSIAMWDFSWLMAPYPGGAYDDLERRVAEAAERGYNTLRVDCFPSRILESESTFPAKKWIPGRNLPMWGQIAKDYTCNVREEVARLANLCRK